MRKTDIELVTPNECSKGLQEQDRGSVGGGEGVSKAGVRNLFKTEAPGKPFLRLNG